MIKRILTVAIALLVAISVNAVISTSQESENEEKATNLQILPEDISNEHLKLIMDSFSDALGVKCGFCHSPRKDGKRGLDFASDDNPHKETAREMMKMTTEISDKYFGDLTNEEGVSLQMSCMTCHNGNAKPVMREVRR